MAVFMGAKFVSMGPRSVDKDTGEAFFRGLVCVLVFGFVFVWVSVAVHAQGEVSNLGHQ